MTADAAEAYFLTGARSPGGYRCTFATAPSAKAKLAILAAHPSLALVGGGHFDTRTMEG